MAKKLNIALTTLLFCLITICLFSLKEQSKMLDRQGVITDDLQNRLDEAEKTNDDTYIIEDSETDNDTYVEPFVDYSELAEVYSAIEENEVAIDYLAEQFKLIDNSLDTALEERREIYDILYDAGLTEPRN